MVGGDNGLFVAISIFAAGTIALIIYSIIIILRRF